MHHCFVVINRWNDTYISPENLLFATPDVRVTTWMICVRLVYLV